MADRNYSSIDDEAEEDLGYTPAPVSEGPEDVTPLEEPPVTNAPRQYSLENPFSDARKLNRPPVWGLDADGRMVQKIPEPEPEPETPAVSDTAAAAAAATSPPADPRRAPRGPSESIRDYAQRRLGRPIDPRATDEQIAQVLSGTTGETPLTDTPAPRGGGRRPSFDSDKLRRMTEIEFEQRQPADQKEFDEHQAWSQTWEGRVTAQNADQAKLLNVARQRDIDLMTLEKAGVDQVIKQHENQAAFEKGQQEAALIRRGVLEETRKIHKQKIAKADKAVDDFRVQDDRNVAERIFGAIFAALGALGSGLTGQPNYALEILDKNIDRRIESQKIELQKRKEKAEGARNDLAEYVNEFQDEEQASELLRIRYLREQAAALEKVKSQVKTDQAQKTIDVLQTERLLKASMEERKFELTMEQNAMAKLQGMSGSGGGKPAGAGPVPDNYEVLEMNWDQAGQYRPDLAGVVLSGASAQQAAWIAEHGEHDKVIQLADQLIERLESSKRPGVGVNWNKEQAAINAMIAAGTQRFSKAEGGGIITQYDILKEMLDNPKEWAKTYETAIEKAKVMRQLAIQNRQALKQKLNVIPTDRPVYAGMGPDGKPIFKARLHPIDPELLGAERRRSQGEAGQDTVPSDSETIRLEQEMQRLESEIEKANTKPKKSGSKSKKDE